MTDKKVPIEIPIEGSISVKRSIAVKHPIVVKPRGEKIMVISPQHDETPAPPAPIPRHSEKIIVISPKPAPAPVAPASVPPVAPVVAPAPEYTGKRIEPVAEKKRHIRISRNER